MSITLIKGTPGSGKSYESVVNHILPALKDGRKVVTNIPLNVEHFALVLGDAIKNLIVVKPFDFDSSTPYLASPEDYKEFQEWRSNDGQGCLFVLDECHLLFPLSGRGKAQSELSEAQIKFFSGHRHWGFDFIFITQSDRKINRLIREDIEICIEVRKNRAISEKSYRRYVYYYGDGKKSGLIEQSSRTYEDKYFTFYTSHTKSDVEVKEASIKDMKKWHQSWTLRITITLLLLGIISSTFTLSSLFGEKKQTPTSVVNTNNNDERTHKSSPKKETPVKKISTFDGLPYGSFELYIDGYSDVSYIDERGVYHMDKRYYFTAVNKSKFELPLKLDDLYLAGYEVSVYSPCMIRITYGQTSKLIYCRGEKPSNIEQMPTALSNLAS